MKEVELTGETIEEICDQLKRFNPKQVKRYDNKENTFKILPLVSYFKYTNPLGTRMVKIIALHELKHMQYTSQWELVICPEYPDPRFSYFLCIEEEENETFEEMARRKQEEIFRSLK